jgi:hypothetical protein
MPKVSWNGKRSRRVIRLDIVRMVVSFSHRTRLPPTLLQYNVFVAKEHKSELIDCERRCDSEASASKQEQQERLLSSEVTNPSLH